MPSATWDAGVADFGYHYDMVGFKDIDRLVDQIARRFEPERISLFGSYATGTPTADSDIDLFIVMSHRGASYRAASRVRLSLDVNFPVDLIVRSPAEFKRRLAMNDFFLLDIVENGLVLHDANDSGVGREGRRRLRRRMPTMTPIPFRVIRRIRYGSDLHEGRAQKNSGTWTG
jgi:predicted nucleotidyltransferase